MPTIVNDTSPVFPACPSFGFGVGLNLLVKKTELESGRVRRDRKWLQGLRSFDGVPVAPRPQRDIEEIVRFYWAIGGESIVFRFTDWTDYTSSWLDDEPAGTDQPFLFEAGSPGGGYQLVKLYEDQSSGLTEARKITRPQGETILVANEVGTLQTDWILDESTGLLQPGGGFAGTPTAWGGLFYVPVAFEGKPQITIENKKIMGATFTLQEQREATS